MRSVVEEVDALVARVGKHPVWGYGHCVWVHSLAEELARAERLSYLNDADFPLQAARTAIEAIEAHPPGHPLGHLPGAPPGSGAEATLLKDAVALEYLGVVGLSRGLPSARQGRHRGRRRGPEGLRAVWHAESLGRQSPNLLVLETSEDIAYSRGHEISDSWRI